MEKTIQEIKEILKEEHFIDAGVAIYTEKEVETMVKEHLLDQVSCNLDEIIFFNEHLIDIIINNESFYYLMTYYFLTTDEMIELCEMFDNQVDFLKDYLGINELIEILIKKDILKKDYKDIIVNDLLNDETEKFLLNFMDEKLEYNNKTFYTLKD